MKMVVYLLSAATAVTVPSVVANQLGIRIGDLSYFAAEDEPPPPPEEAQQLVSYEEALAKAADTPETPTEEEEMAPKPSSYGRSYVALPDATLVAVRGRLVKLTGGDSAAKKSSGGH